MNLSYHWPSESELSLASLKVFFTFNFICLVHITDYIELADDITISSRNATRKLTGFDVRVKLLDVHDGNGSEDGDVEKGCSKG